MRVSHDRWEVDACPHHGGALSIASDGIYHLVWFNNAPERHGLFYAYTADRGKTFSAPLTFGNFEAQAGHPDVLSLGKAVHVVWKEFDGQELGHQGDVTPPMAAIHGPAAPDRCDRGRFRSSAADRRQEQGLSCPGKRKRKACSWWR